MTPVSHTVPAPDLLSQAVDHVRPHLRRDLPLADRLRAFWAGVAAARDLGAHDQVEGDFLELAWTTGLAADMGKHAAVDLRHVISWAMRGMDPFGAKP